MEPDIIQDDLASDSKVVDVSRQIVLRLNPCSLQATAENPSGYPLSLLELLNFLLENGAISEIGTLWQVGVPLILPIFPDPFNAAPSPINLPGNRLWLVWRQLAQRREAFYSPYPRPAQQLADARNWLLLTATKKMGEDTIALFRTEPCVRYAEWLRPRTAPSDWSRSIHKEKGKGEREAADTRASWQPELNLPENWSKLIPNYEPAVMKGRIAILDTGVDSTHVCLPQLRDLTSNQRIRDSHSHGTFICSMIASTGETEGRLQPVPMGIFPGIVPDVRRVMYPGSLGVSDTYYYTALADIAYHPRNLEVINLSLGGIEFLQTEAEHIAMVLRGVPGKAGTGGVSVVAAAGNTDDGNSALDTVHFPALLPGVISAGAFRKGLKDDPKMDHAWQWGNVGAPKSWTKRFRNYPQSYCGVDVGAVGEELNAAYPMDRNNNAVTQDMYSGLKSGSSFAAPLVSCAVAAWRMMMLTDLPSPWAREDGVRDAISAKLQTVNYHGYDVTALDFVRFLSR